MGHEFQDRVSLELARRIVAGLPQNPEWVQHAQDNLERWSSLNSDAPGLLRCYDEWSEVLRRPVTEICDVLIARSDEGQRMRQNSPFVGILSPSEVWSIKRKCREETSA